MNKFEQSVKSKLLRYKQDELDRSIREWCEANGYSDFMAEKMIQMNGGEDY